MPKQTGPRPKHVPQRTCVACRKTENKRGLIRLVRLQDQRVAIDPTGKQSGRGAYLCSDRACWETALKRKAIERALRIERLHPDDATRLRDYAESLPLGNEESIDQRVPVTS